MGSASGLIHKEYHNLFRLRAGAFDDFHFKLSDPVNATGDLVADDEAGGPGRRAREDDVARGELEAAAQLDDLLELDIH